MTTPTPKETALDPLRSCEHRCRLRSGMLGGYEAASNEQEGINLRKAIAWLDGLQAESDERAVRAFVQGCQRGALLRYGHCIDDEAEARRLLAEGRLGTDTGGTKP